ncbi:MAG: M48 family metallopeptidase [Deltaproteobacteria bacterium]|nr:M48 family metallopeptidase [Deltaproteobacteria bacterium]
MNFFESQDTARSNTKKLVLLFALAVAAIIIGVYVVVVVVGVWSGFEREIGYQAWQPELFALVAFVTIFIVLVGSTYKTLSLRRGGSAVARTLGGVLIQPDTQDPLQRRLLNIVEEMAIASGIQVPDVYLLQHESGINAFAAGYTPADAVIGVTQGCIEQLSRDELQGVIAHEFSHIFNGDMRLNIRLMGILHGILVIALIGYSLVRGFSYSTQTVSSRSREKNSGGMLIFLGIGLMAIGYIGVFFGKLIKSAVSRQREFLADASAVQFTRNPDGIAGALKKIGGFDLGSTVLSPGAEEASHMFFGNALRGSISHLFSTHPPLTERIKRIDPSFDGDFYIFKFATEGRISKFPGEYAQKEDVYQFNYSSEYHPHESKAELSATTEDVISKIGAPSSNHLSYASSLLWALPETLKDMAHNKLGAKCIVYLLLLDQSPEIRDKQLETLFLSESKEVVSTIQNIYSTYAKLGEEFRLPLLDLSIPALKQLTESEYLKFQTELVNLIHSDGKVSLFEFVLVRILLHSVEVNFNISNDYQEKHTDINSILHELQIVYSALAHFGHLDHEELGINAFAAAARKTDTSGRISYLRPEEFTLDQVDAALTELAHCSHPLKEIIIAGATESISSDGKVTINEGELLRAVCESLDVPLPPFLPGQNV